MELIYKPKSGNFVGLPHKPYKNKEGLFVVSKDRFQKNYIYVNTIEEVYAYLEKGLKVRMQYQNNSPSLINLMSLEIIS
ncbi:hypothetical protein GHJ48_13360 [Acinetobacter sp. dk771]|uniref:Uncharacterized protein n=1 Tax=Acinetobacter wanghuae TaxID=2662362 RepID=A0AA90WGW7_9GAMM|nr:hypothetical protein [Acinetobacter wanghuae]MQW93363.1 hypothetical protein [Acinetobacter wanghuae]